MSLIAGAWLARSKRVPVKPGRKAKPEDKHDGGSRLPVASNVVRPDAAKHCLKTWLDNGTVAGGELRGGEALKVYKCYAGGMAKDMTANDLRQFLAEILGAGAIAARTSGYVVRIAADEGRRDLKMKAASAKGTLGRR